MKARRLALLIAFYITLDFANPWMPGALNFDADESVDGITIQHHQPRPQFGPVPTPVPLRAELRPARQGAAVRPAAPAVSEWLVGVRQSHASPSSDPPSPTEDH
ncbi:MAG TPA: hypothetical protein VGT40_02525 [Methylomirabilota bacterium]|jgi:hypothetical protein|nr:hypothetical protein [Methylomirabilota bacterium]